MDREPEKLQNLGAYGIIVVACKILFSCFKLLALTLILPLSFVILAHNLLTQPLFRKIFMNLSSFLVEGRSGSPEVESTLQQINMEWGEVLLIELSYVAFLLAFSLLSTSAVVYTVVCLYAGKDVSYAKVISVVPRVWRRLMITFLWFFTIMFVYHIFVAVLRATFTSVLINAGNNNEASLFFVIGVVLLAVFLAIVFFCVYVYITMVWEFASVVSVVEDEYGMGAMKKSMELIKGKRGTAVALNIIYLVTVGIISELFQYRVVHGGKHSIGVGKRAANGAVLVVVQTAVCDKSDVAADSERVLFGVQVVSSPEH